MLLTQSGASEPDYSFEQELASESNKNFPSCNAVNEDGGYDNCKSCSDWQNTMSGFAAYVWASYATLYGTCCAPTLHGTCCAVEGHGGGCVQEDVKEDVEEADVKEVPVYGLTTMSGLSGSDEFLSTPVRVKVRSVMGWRRDKVRGGGKKHAKGKKKGIHAVNTIEKEKRKGKPKEKVEGIEIPSVQDMDKNKLHQLVKELVAIEMAKQTVDATEDNELNGESETTLQNESDVQETTPLSTMDVVTGDNKLNTVENN